MGPVITSKASKALKTSEILCISEENIILLPTQQRLNEIIMHELAGIHARPFRRQQAESTQQAA